jgi:hypothetical protein
VKGLAAVARLELERRWMLPPLALAVGVVPFGVAPLLLAPGSDSRGMLGNLLALLLTLTAALLLGATTLAGDLVAGRLAFYFSRPLPWWAIWGGKLTAALGLTLASGLLALAPTSGLGLDLPLRHPVLYGNAAVVTAGLAAVAIGLAHWGAVAARSHSSWLVLDVLALPVVAWLWANSYERMGSRGLVPTSGGASVFVGLFAFAVLAAGAAQMAVGRTSTRRSHAAVSLTGWALLALLAGGLQYVSRSAITTEPGDLRYAQIARRAPSGGSAWIVGAPEVPGFQAWSSSSFLADEDTVRPLAVPPYAATDAFAFAGNGERGLWLRRGERGHELHAVEVRDGSTRVVELRTPLSSQGRVGRMLADERGHRVAILQRDAAAVFDATAGERELALETRTGGRVECILLGEAGAPDVVYRAAPEGGVVIEPHPGAVAMPSGRLGPPAEGNWKRLHIDTRGQRLLALASGEARLADARTGETLAAFELDPAASADGLLLSDGRLLLVEASGWARLRLLDAAGEELGRLDLGRHDLVPASRVQVAEAEPGVAIVAFGYAERLVVVDLEPFRIARVDEGVAWGPHVGPGLAVVQDRPVGATLFVDVPGDFIGWSVVRYDTRTGERVPLAGPAAR